MPRASYLATVKKLRGGSATLQWDDKDPRSRVVPAGQLQRWSAAAEQAAIAESQAGVTAAEEEETSEEQESDGSEEEAEEQDSELSDLSLASSFSSEKQDGEASASCANPAAEQAAIA